MKGYILQNDDGNLVSGTTPHGGCYVSTPAATTVTSSGTFYVLAGTTTALALSNFTHASPGRLTYTGTVSCVFFITGTMSFVSSANNINVKTRLAKNGTTDATTEQAFTKTTSTDTKQVSSFGIMTLVQNDYVELYVTCDSNGATVTANNAVLMANVI